ncbi:MAG: hypothetical protein P9L94_12225 [Candidatus Hinthialibacter antarcticus]|nr:hypothetical protein [Candidatus Hinthialibacter antarcticus]
MASEVSKRRQGYLDGVDQICAYLEAFLERDETPGEKDIQAELKAIDAFRPIITEIALPEIQSGEGYFLLVEEEYVRVDDVLPEAVRIQLLPQSMDEQKVLNRLLTYGREGGPGALLYPLDAAQPDRNIGD